MTAWGLEERGETLTALPWGTQENGVGAVQGGARVGRSDIVKAPSVATNKEGVWGHHWARPAQGGVK